jgi:hypothetical protein
MQNSVITWPRSQGELAGLGRAHFAEFFELNAQPMAERALGSQFFQQVFCFVEVFGGEILRLEQIAKAALNLIFGKQGSLSRLRMRSIER